MSESIHDVQYSVLSSYVFIVQAEIYHQWLIFQITILSSQYCNFIITCACPAAACLVPGCASGCFKLAVLVPARCSAATRVGNRSCAGMREFLGLFGPFVPRKVG
jgi:hypothetical protein